MAFKVLNEKGERVIVDSIDPKKHRHLSGREFPSIAKKVIEKVAPKKPSLKSKK